MTDIAKIAAGLTKAQRDALCGLFTFASPVEQDEGEIALVEAGLWNGLFGRVHRERLTQLGLSVRQYLLEQEQSL